MARSAEQSFLINLTVDGEQKTVIANASLVEMLNSQDSSIRQLGYAMVAKSLSSSGSRCSATSTTQLETSPVGRMDHTYSGDTSASNLETSQTNPVGRLNNLDTVENSLDSTCSSRWGLACNDANSSDDDNSTCTASTESSIISADNSKRWTENETKLLFQLRADREQTFTGANVHTNLWAMIAKEMTEKHRIKVTGKQCSNKWKSMKRLYRQTVDQNSKTGESKKDCPFYEEFNNLYGNRSGTRPKYVMGSSHPKSDVQLSSLAKSWDRVLLTGSKTADRVTSKSCDTAPVASTSSESCNTGNSSESCDPGDTVVKPKEKKKTRKRARAAPAALEWLERYEERQEQLAQKRLDTLNQHHNEKLALMTRFIESIERSSKKDEEEN